MCIDSLKVLFLLGMATKCLGGANYDVKFESVMGYEGEDENVMDCRGLKIIGRERSINGSIFNSVDLTDDYEISIEIFSFKMSTWVPVPYGGSYTPCEYFENFFLKYVDPANQNTNFPITSEAYCPLRKGEYWLINVTPNTDKWVSHMKRGLVKLSVKVRKNGKLVGGFEIVGDIVDRTY